MDENLAARVRERAHRLWEEAGRPEGQADEHWAQAQRELQAEEAALLKQSTDEIVPGQEHVAEDENWVRERIEDEASSA